MGGEMYWGKLKRSKKHSGWRGCATGRKGVVDGARKNARERSSAGPERKGL